MIRHKKDRSSIPPSAEWILEKFCSDDLLEEFLGDLEEIHAERRSSRGVFFSNLLLARDLVSFLRVRFRRKQSARTKSYKPVLVSSYLTVAWRGILRNRGYSVINIAGLGAGLACCILIGLYVQDELSYDGFHANGNRVFRVTSVETNAGRSSSRASTHIPLVPTLIDEFPSIEKGTRIYPFPALVTHSVEKSFQEEGLVFVDSTFLEIFSFGMRVGDRNSALDEPFSLVLTESSADRYFGGVNPLGEVLSLRTDTGAFDFTVTGIVADVPENSHFTFEIAASISSLREIAPHHFSWYWPPAYSYIMLRDEANAGSIQEALPTFTSKYLDGLGLSRTYNLQPLSDIHLRSNLENEIAPTGSIRYVLLFTVVALLILLIGSINFMNLATARSVGRAREVGMRKALGARRIQLAGQFLSESLVTALVSMILGVFFAWALLPAFGSLTGKSLSLQVLSQGWTPVALLGLACVVGLLTGSYPAFFLSAFRPIRVLKGILPADSGSTSGLRRGLVVLQFSITSILIVGTFVIQRQLSFLQTDRLGFDKDHVVVVPLRDRDNQINHTSLKEQWEMDPRILSVASSSGYPGFLDGLHDFIVIPEDAREDSLEMLILTADHDFAETYGLELVAGRDFSEDYPTDATEGFLINESAARKIGWTDPVGKELTLDYYVTGNVIKKGRVLGVVRDFQYMSLHRKLDPIVFHVQENSFFNDFVSIRLSGTDVAGALGYLKEGWNTFNPDRPFEYRFVDEAFGEMYRSDSRLAIILRSFSILAILIACLGLFALAAYTTEQRTREIGVRKAMGASISNVVFLLSKQFLVLVLLAFVLAVPVSYLVMRYWLDGFAAQIDLGASVFLLAGIMAFLISVLSVGYQSVRAATTNPAVALRHE